MSDTSISFANIVPLGGSQTGTATPTSQPRQTAKLDDSTILGYFTKPYLLAHELSWPSFRYAAYFWFIMAGLLVLGSIYHVLTRRGGGAMGAAVNKYSIKQVIWDRKRRRPGATKTHSSTTLGQTVAIVVLFAMTFCLCYIGVDYVDPRTCLFGGTCPAAASAAPPKTTFVGKRELFAAEPDESISHIQKLFPRDGGKDLNAGGYAPYMDPLLSGPNTDVDKNYWTSSSRLGLISYAMYPLVVSLALKMWPFNIFATPWLTDWAYNKTGLFHRWFGRIIFILATLHVVLWTIQLFKDQDPYGRATFYPVWEYWRFKAGVVAYAAICAMVVLSLAPLRKRFYEITYYLHAALVIVLLVGSALHYKYLAPYCYIALGIWGGERVFRLAHWIFINGSPFKTFVIRPSQTTNEKDEWSNDPYEYPDITNYFQDDEDYSNVYQDTRDPEMSPSQIHLHSNPTFRADDKPLAPSVRLEDIPAGYALAQVLPGKTIRLQIHVPRRVYWRTGQHISLTIPAVRLWQGHPFTISVADERITRRSAALRNGGSCIESIIRVKGGFTKALYHKIQGLTDASLAPVLLRAQVGWPLGSNKGASIQDYSSVVIVCGGSGISFGAGVFEHGCYALAQRLSKRTKLQRVKLVWLLREFAHITWVAPQIYRCLKMVKGNQDVSVQFFVTQDSSSTVIPASNSQPYDLSSSMHVPPRPNFRHQSESRPSFESNASNDNLAEELQTNSEDIAGLSDVEFEGEEEGLSPREQRLDQQVKKTGKIRRANSRLGQAEKVQSQFKIPRPNSASTINTYDYPPSATESRLKNLMPSTVAFADSDQRGDSVASTLNLPFKLNEEEESAVNALAEFTVSGKPDLKHLLAEEVASSPGKMLLAACGPPALNSKMRKWTSQLISPSKIWHGDESGQIDLFLEDYA